ncbi:MAG: hypothetical protein ACRBM6_34955 [Geminicoccales bacterium]
MYELLIVACLVGQPKSCDEFHIPFERPTGIMMCLRDAQFRLSQWTATRPEWMVKKWSCGLPKA